MNSLLKAAQKYVNFGWSVIPIAKGLKTPALPSWKEYQTRLPDKVELERWFSAGSNDLAILTGAISGLTVLDADSPASIEGLGKMQIRSPITAKTKRGRHLYFKFSQLCPTGTGLREHLDVRSEGGYVVAPPTNGYIWLLPFSSISVLPDFPASLLRRTPKQEVSISANGPDWIAKALEGLKPGNRDSTFVKIIGRLHRERLGADSVLALLVPHAEACGFGAELLREKVSYVFKKYENKDDSAGSGFKIYNPSADWKEYETRRASKSSLDGPELPTGFASLDTMLGGFQRGEVYTIGARTGVGKTNFAVNVTINMLKEGKRVLFLSTEMSFDTIWERGCRLASEDALRRSAFYTSDISSPTRKQVEAMLEEVQPDILIFDHIQHMGGETQSRYHELSTFVKALKDLARERQIAVLVVSQLNRGADGVDRNGQRVRPHIYHLKECGSIEEESTAVMLLHRDHPIDDTHDFYVLNVAKNRYGLSGEINVSFDKTTTRMEEIQ